MEIKYNNGNLAVLCSKCKAIVDSHFGELELKTYEALCKSGEKWFCHRCALEKSLEQLDRFAVEYRKQKILEEL